MSRNDGLCNTKIDDEYNKTDRIQAMKGGYDMQNEQKEMSLNELENGECGYVTVLDTNISLRSRLRELGLIEGTKVTKVCTAFLGSPCAYNIRGAIIALRNSDTNDIKVIRNTV